MRKSKKITWLLHTKIAIIPSIIVLLSLAPIVDSYTGFCKLTGISGGELASLLYRAFLIVICIIIYISSSNENEWIKLITLVVWIAMSVLWHVIYSDGTGSLGNDFVQYMKLFYPLVLYQALDKLMKKRMIAFKNIEQLFLFYMIFIPASIIIPKIMGTGFYTYANMESGFKGFYYGGNGINILAIILMLYAGENNIEKPSISHTILLMLNVITVVLIGTKTSILSLGFLLVIYMFFQYRKRKKILPVLAILAVISLLAWFYIFQNQDFFDSIINRLNYEYSRVDGNLIDFVTNSRIRQGIQKIQEAVDYKDVLCNVIWGVGYTRYTKVVEMDFVDIWMHYGIVILIEIIFFYYQCYKECVTPYIRYCFGFCIMYACFAGHLLISPLGNSIFVLYALKGKYQRKGKIYEKNCYL